MAERYVVGTLNEGRGSAFVVKQHIDAIHELLDGDVTLVSAQKPKFGVKGNYDFQKVDLEPLPIPVHEFLPNCERQVAANTLTAEVAEQYIEKYALTFEAVVKTEKPKLLLLHHANLSTIAGAEVAKKFDIPYSVYVHGTCLDGYLQNSDKDPELWSRVVQSLKDANYLITASNAVAENLILPNIPISKDRIIQIPPHLEPEYEIQSLRTDNLDSQSEPTVVYVGALIESKGPQVLAEASKHYKHLAQTVFVGSGSLQSKLQTDNPDLIFTGFIPEQEKIDILNRASLVVVPSQKEEHFGISLIEGMATCGAVVSPNFGGISEIVEHGEDGMKVDSRDPYEIGNAVKTILEDKNLRNKIARRAKNNVFKKYSSTAVRSQLSGMIYSSVS